MAVSLYQDLPFDALKQKDREIKISKESIMREIADLERQLQVLHCEFDGFEDTASEEVDSAEKQLNSCVRKFNESAKKGIAELVQKQLIDGSPASIANFLYSTPRLNKTQIGECLGEGDKTHFEILELFAKLHDFTSRTFDEALRQYLWSFRLPGEAQKIDRMMEQFAARFCECNPSIFSSRDACYVLAFSIIMLNTSLHNPSVKNKPTLEIFIHMNRGLNNGENFSSVLLTGLFESIKRTPFKLPDDATGDALTFINPERNGWLVKQGGGHKTWHRRWFTLCNNCVYYFAREADTKPKGHIPLENLEVRRVEDKSGKFIFEIYFPDSAAEVVIKAAKLKDGKMTQGRHSSYRIQGDTQADVDEWIKCIRAAMTKNPFYQLYCKRKEIVNTSSAC